MSEKLSRDERQDLCIANWKKYNGKATILAATGFGKTRIAIKTIQRIIKLKPKCSIIVIVPTDYLKIQWITVLAEFNVQCNIKVIIVHTAIKLDLACDLLIVDEVHMMVAATFKSIFTKVRYSFIMCLTGTIDRLDGKESILKHYAPICDEISLADAIANDWIADYNQYKILIDVDLTDYKKYHRDFLHYFSYFNFDFGLAMRMLDYQQRIFYAKQNNLDVKVVTVMALGFNRSMQARKNFIYEHPRKIEITNQIVEARLTSKIITFTKTKKHAEQLKYGKVFHGSLTKKKKAEIINEYILMKSGVLNTCKALDVGTDVPGVDTIVLISTDSASITKKQKVGRAIRKEGEKVATVYHLVIRGTVEEEWYRKASTKMKSLSIDESELASLLQGKKPKELKDNKTQLLFRF